MFDPKANTKTKAPLVVPSESSRGKLAMMPDDVPSDSKIRERAYQLYEGRGREPGQDEQDWLRAEREILEQEELEHELARVLADASGQVLSDAEVQKFWHLHEEILRRRAASGNAA